MSSKFTFEQRIRQDILLLTVNEDFMLDVEVIKKKYNLPLNTDDYDEYSDGPEFLKSDDYKNDFYNLRRKYIIPESHDLTLEFYLLHGHINFDNGIFDSLWHLNPGAKTNNNDNCIILKIYPDTTLKDIQENWPRIKKYKDKILNREVEKKVKIKNLDRDLEILKLKKEGKSSSEIISIINKDIRFNKVILGYEDISKIIERLKLMSKRNMASKKS